MFSIRKMYWNRSTESYNDHIKKKMTTSSLFFSHQKIFLAKSVSYSFQFICLCEGIVVIIPGLTYIHIAICMENMIGYLYTNYYARTCSACPQFIHMNWCYTVANIRNIFEWIVEWNPKPNINDTLLTICLENFSVRNSKKTLESQMFFIWRSGVLLFLKNFQTCGSCGVCVPSVRVK